MQIVMNQQTNTYTVLNVCLPVIKEKAVLLRIQFGYKRDCLF